VYLLVDRRLYVIFVLFSYFGVFLGVGLLLIMPHYGSHNKIEEVPTVPSPLNAN